jgi:hypothetical protein
MGDAVEPFVRNLQPVSAIPPRGLPATSRPHRTAAMVNGRRTL